MHMHTCFFLSDCYSALCIIILLYISHYKIVLNFRKTGHICWGSGGGSSSMNNSYLLIKQSNDTGIYRRVTLTFKKLLCVDRNYWNHNPHAHHIHIMWITDTRKLQSWIMQSEGFWKWLGVMHKLEHYQFPCII